MLGNPVPGHIQARGETWNKTGFIVTSTYAEHKASGRALGIDIGNGKQGADVYAMESGTVQFAGGIVVTGMPSAALVVRIRHPQLDNHFGGKPVVSGYAHLQSMTVKIGQAVTRGQVIGKVGMTGATAPHLHGGFTVAGVEIDWWPLLDQEDAMPTHVVNARLFLGADGKPTQKTVTFAPGTYTGYSLDGASEKVTLAAASSAPADAVCQILQDPKIAPNGSGFLRITAGAFVDHPYVLQSQPGISVPPDPPVGGPSDQQLADAYNAGRSAVQAAAASVPPK